MAETFDVNRHLIKVQSGKEYLPVAARLIWFRQEHPDWGIETRLADVSLEKGYAIFEAIVYNAEGKLMAKGTKMETARGFPDYLEKAETGSIGRALALCGFGTQFALELDEGERIVDAPHTNKNKAQPSNHFAVGDAKRQEYSDAIAKSWEVRAQTDSAFSSAMRRWNSILSWCGRENVDVPAEIKRLGSPTALRRWLDTAPLDQVRGYGQHNLKRAKAGQTEEQKLEEEEEVAI